MSQHITVIEYSPLWKNKYKEESLLIRNILADNCIAIYHIGSTSVEGLAAKPIIDIMAVVRSLEIVGGDERTHQIHIFQADDWNNIGRHLAFRDYMRTHEKEREEYAKIKIELAKKYPYDIDGYCDGKENFVREMEEIAISQFDGTWDKMYIAARKVQYERKLSPLIEAGTVSAALLTEKGNIYVGVCIDTACSLGMCAERNAIANMITNGECTIQRVIAIGQNGNAIPPCGACREFMTQLALEKYHSIQIMLDYENKKVVALGDITSNWWI